MCITTGLANVTEARTVAGVTKRLIAVRRKELPSVAKQERSRVFVEKVNFKNMIFYVHAHACMHACVLSK